MRIFNLKKDKFSSKSIIHKRNNKYYNLEELINADYSNEIIIGLFNSQPIYRKILHSTDTIQSSSTGIVGYLTNVSKIIMITGSVKAGNNYISIPASHPSSFNWQMGIYYDAAAKAVKIETGSSRTISESFIVVDYLK